MKTFDTDWRDFFQRLPTWERLSTDARRAFTELKSTGGVERAALGEEGTEILLEAGFVTPFASAPKVRLHKDCYPFAKVIRAMYRHDILGEPDTDTFAEYLRDLFTNDQKAGLLSGADQGGSYGYGGFETALARTAMSARWPEGFLAAKTRKEAERWEKQRHPSSAGWQPYSGIPARQPQRFAEPGVYQAVRALVEHCMASSHPIPMQDLPELLSDASEEARAAAIPAAVRYLLLFPMIRREDMQPVLGLWPTIPARIHRPRPKPPQPVTPSEHFHTAFLMEDMTTVLIAASAEPLRVRGNDYALFARAQRELESSLLSLPGWVASLDGCLPAQRLLAAINFLKDKGLIQLKGKAGKDLRIERTGRAEDWLGLSAKDRLKTLLDDLRPPEPQQPGKARKKTRAAAGRSFRDQALDFIDGLVEEEEEWFDPYDKPAPGRDEFLPRSVLGAIDKNRDEAVSTACVHALASLPEDQYVPLLQFLVYQSVEANPLPTLGPNGRPLNIRLGWSRRHQPLEEEMEGLWAKWLSDLLRIRLLPLGGIRVGLPPKEKDDLCVALTETGRYLLRLTDDFDYGHDDARGQIIVQPNFDVAFLAPSPLAEATISRFAERTGSGLGVLFKITRKSIFTAAGSGLTREQVLDTLREVCDKGVPANVEREVRGWFDQCRRVTVEPAVLIRCPDPETAARVIAAGGKKTQPLTDTLVQLTEPKLSTTLTRKLKDAGLFPDPPSKPTKSRPGRGRRPRGTY